MLQSETALVSPGQAHAKPARGRMVRRAHLALTAVLWALAIIGTFLHHPAFTLASAVLFASYIAAMLFVTTWENWAPSLIVITAIVILGYIDGSWAEVDVRLNESLNLLAVVGTLQILRLVALRDPRMLAFRRKLSNEPMDRRPAWLLVAANLFGSVLGSGSTATLASTLHIRADANVRRTSATAVIAGCALTTCWSPVFVSMAVITSYAPAVPVWHTVLVGLGLTCIGMTIALMILRIERPLSAAGQATRAAAPLLPLVAAGGLAVVLTASLGFTTLEASALALPPLALALVLTYGRSASSRIYSVGRVSRMALIGVARSGGEIAMLSLVFVLARMMGTSPAFGQAMVGLGITDIPGYVAVAAVAFGILVLSPVSIHPMITVSIMLAIFSPARVDVATPILLGAALLGWSSTAMISFTGFLVVISTRLFNLTRLDIILGRNLFLALAYTTVGSAYLMTLAWVFR